VQWHLLSKDSINGWKAFNSIGSIYFKGGEGVEKNYHQALKWFNKGATLDDDEADLNIAYTWDNLRNEATSDVKREEYRLNALENYKRIGCMQSSSHCGSNISRFNAIFLTHLNEKGAFAPKDLNSAASLYTELNKSKIKDRRVPLMRALVEYLLLQQKRKVGGNINDKKFIGFLESASKLGSLNAKKLLELNSSNSLMFKKRMEIILNNPQCAYLDQTNF
nr:sel1 repeat family protein [Nitrosopumilus sp.]